MWMFCWPTISHILHQASDKLKLPKPWAQKCKIIAIKIGEDDVSIVLAFDTGYNMLLYLSLMTTTIVTTGATTLLEIIALNVSLISLVSLRVHM